MTALEDFRLDAGQVPARPRKRTAPAPWAPLTPDRLAPGTVLAFDQSLRSTGWCVLNVTAGAAWISGAGTVTTKPGRNTGWTSMLADADVLVLELDELLRTHPGAALVHELPPTRTPKGGISGRFSSPLAATVLRSAAVLRARAVAAVEPQDAKWLLTGDRRADKPAMGAAVRALTWLSGRERLTNEHARDAAAIALTHLAERTP